MRLLAISDVHLGYPANRAALQALAPHPDDWLLVGGDLGERVEQVVDGLAALVERFARVFWVPGNHELWALEGPRGVARYHLLVEACRALGVVTPEDPFVAWPGDGHGRLICPLFLLYDYSFAPDGMDPAAAVRWAAEDGIVAMDERWLFPDPYPSREAWCAARVAWTERRLVGAGDHRLVLLSHWPLRRDVIRIPRVPRYTPWCGTRRTEPWFTRFPIEVAVHGHLHVRATDWIGGVRVEEVALGYPRHWRQEAGMAHYLREILPGPPRPTGPVPTVWHR